MSSNLGAQCARHPHVGAVHICTRCGDFICQECVGENTYGAVTCSSCTQGSHTHGEHVIPFEERERHGFVGAFWKTAVSTITSPGTAFKGVSPHGSMSDPMVYLLCVGFLMGLLAIPQQLAQVFAAGADGADIGLAAGLGIGLGTAVIMPIAMPLGLVLGQFIHAGLMHLCLMMVGGAREGYNATFRGLAYTQSIGLVTTLFQLLLTPIAFFGLSAYTMAGGLGGLVSMVVGLYALVLQGAAIRDVHGASTGQVFGAFAIYIGAAVLFVCGCIGLIAGLGGAAASSGF